MRSSALNIVAITLLAALTVGCDMQSRSWVGPYSTPSAETIANDIVSLNLRDFETDGQEYWKSLSIIVYPDNRFTVEQFREYYRAPDAANRFVLISQAKGQLQPEDSAKFRRYLAVLRPEHLSRDFNLTDLDCSWMDAAASINVNFVDEKKQGGGFVYWPNCDRYVPQHRKANLRRLLIATRALIPEQLATDGFETAYPTISSGLKK